MASAASIPSSFNYNGDSLDEKRRVLHTLQNTWSESHPDLGARPTDGQLTTWLQNMPNIESIQRAYMRDGRALTMPSQMINAIAMNQLLTSMLVLAPLNFTDDEEYRFAWEDPHLPLFEEVAELAIPMVISSERGESRTTRRHYKAAANIEANYADDPVYGAATMANKIAVLVAGISLTINWAIIQRLKVAGAEGRAEVRRHRLDNPDVYQNLLELEEKSFMAGSGNIGQLQEMIIAALRVNPMIDTIVLPPNCHIMHSQANSPEVKVSTNVNVGGQTMEISNTLNREQISSVRVNGRDILIISIPSYHTSMWGRLPDQTRDEIVEASIFVGHGSDQDGATGGISLRDIGPGGSFSEHAFTPADAVRDSFLLFGEDGQPAQMLHKYAHKLTLDGTVPKDQFNGDHRGKSVNEMNKHAYKNLNTTTFPYLTYNTDLQQWFVPRMIGDFSPATVTDEAIDRAAEKVVAKMDKSIEDALTEVVKLIDQCTSQVPTKDYLDAVFAWAKDPANQQASDAKRAKYFGVEPILEGKFDSATGGVAMRDILTANANTYGNMTAPAGFGTLPNLVYIASLPAEGQFTTFITKAKAAIAPIKGAFTIAVKQYLGEGLLSDSHETPEWMGPHAHELSRLVEVLLASKGDKTYMGAIFAVTNKNADLDGSTAFATSGVSYTEDDLKATGSAPAIIKQVYGANIDLLNKILELLKGDSATGPAEMDQLFTNVTYKIKNSKNALDRLPKSTLPSIVKYIKSAAQSTELVIPVFSGNAAGGYKAVDEGYKGSSASGKGEVVVRLALRGSAAWFGADTDKNFRAGAPASHYSTYLSSTDTDTLASALFATDGLAALSPARMGLEAHRGDISLVNLKTKADRSMGDHMGMQDHHAGFVGPWIKRNEFAKSIPTLLKKAVFLLLAYGYNEVKTYVSLHRAGAWLLRVGYVAHKQVVQTQHAFAIARQKKPLVTCMSPVAVRPGEDNVVGMRTIVAEFYMAVCPAGPPGDILLLPDVCAVESRGGFSASVAHNLDEADPDASNIGELLSLPLPMDLAIARTSTFSSQATPTERHVWGDYLKFVFGNDYAFQIGQGSVRHITTHGLGERTNGTGRYGHSRYSEPGAVGLLAHK